MSAKHPSQAAELLPLVDFRAFDDDAWYSVRLRLEDDKLRIMYCNFPEAFDNVFSVESFTGLESIEKFRQRFRPTSTQLQDRDCDGVVKGMRVCASHLFAADDLRFYDATVESVNPSIHPLQEGQCRCKFELLWQHGPLNGKKTIVSIEHLCLTTSRGTVFNLVLEKFLDIMKEKLLSENAELQNLHSFSPVTVPTCTNQIPSSPAAHKSKKSRQQFGSSMHMRALEVEKTLKHTARAWMTTWSKMWTWEGNHFKNV